MEKTKKIGKQRDKKRSGNETEELSNYSMICLLGNTLSIFEISHVYTCYPLSQRLKFSVIRSPVLHITSDMPILPLYL